MLVAKQDAGIVALGAGTSAGSAALALRAAGFDGRVTLIGAESVLPYNRPSLSKEYLRGEEGFEQLLVATREKLDSLSVEVRLGERAIRVDPAGHIVELQSGELLKYSKLLYCAGGRNRHLAVAGIELDGVFGLRTVTDADRIKAAVRPGCRVAILGLGFIGCEVAASLRQVGAEVTAIDSAPAPMTAVLGETVGHVIGGIHSEHGVRLLLNDSVVAFEGHRKLERVRTRAGHLIDADLAVVGVGISPNVELLREAGARVEDGVVVDSLCRTSLADIYAAGDVAKVQHPVFGPVRVEHWNNAVNQSRAAALAMLGEGTGFDYIYSFWSDQYEHSLEYLGIAPLWDEVVFRGSFEARRFLAFYLEDGHLQAVAGLNRGGNPEDHVRGSDLKKCIALVHDRARLDPTALRDEGRPLLSAVVRPT